MPLKVIFLLAGLCISGSCRAAEISLAHPNDRREIQLVVGHLWMAGDFEHLDALEVAFRTHPQNSPSGGSLLYLFYQAMDEAQNPADNNVADMRELNRRAALWTERFPQSQLARFIEVCALMSQAWIARGPQYADQTTDRQWQDYNRLSKKAADYLIQNKHALEGNLNWYRALLGIAQRTSWPESSYSALLKEALSKYPDVREFFLDPINHYSQKWGGSALAIANYIDESTSRLAQPFGDEIYAQQYSYVVENGFPVNSHVPSIDCARWMRGYRAFVDSFPSPYNLNHAAVAASYCRDRNQAKGYFERIGTISPDVSVWQRAFGDAGAFNNLRLWATGGE